MRLLLDECVDQYLRFLLSDFECQTSQYAGLTGFSDEALLDAAEAQGFDVLITVDQRIPFQQNMGGRRMSMVILIGGFDRRSHLESVLPALRRVLEEIPPGVVVRIRK